MRIKTFILASLLALAACQSIGTPNESLVATSAPTRAIPTRTPEPTVTATTLAIPSPTERSLDVNVSIEQSFVSPSGKWLALTIITRIEDETGNNNSSRLVVVNQQNSAERTIEKVNFTSSLGYSLPWSLAWSESEDYLYFTHRLGGGDGCFGEGDFYGTDLYKLNLDNGESSQLTPYLGYWLALSPDRTKIAFLTDDHTLKIRNIETGEEHETTIDERLKYPESTLTYPSHLIWSPNGKELMLTLEVNVCVMEEDAKHSIIKIDAGNLSQTTVVLEDPNRPLILEWADNGMVLVEDENMKYWWLNPRNGQMAEKQ